MQQYPHWLIDAAQGATTWPEVHATLLANITAVLAAQDAARKARAKQFAIAKQKAKRAWERLALAA